MSKLVLVVALAAAAIAAACVASSPASAASCGTVPPFGVSVRTMHTGCVTARQVVRAVSDTTDVDYDGDRCLPSDGDPSNYASCRVEGFRCRSQRPMRSERYPVRCVSDRKVIRFYISF